MKRALITGINGQDGSYLAELLLTKGYEVHGVVRRSSSPNYSRLQNIKEKITLHEGDITDFSFVHSVLELVQPHEIYNLAAQSHVKSSFGTPIYTANVNYIGCLNILEVLAAWAQIKCREFQPKMYQASTSEMYGTNYTMVREFDQYELELNFDSTQTSFYDLWTSNWCGQNDKEYIKERFEREYDPNSVFFPQPYQDENTTFNPKSPYAIAKLAAHQSCLLYRKAYGVNVCCGILFNHESPRRGDEFVTKKIVNYIKQVRDTPGIGYVIGEQALLPTSFPKLKLGNLDAMRDWGYAGDYCIDYNVPILTPNGWKYRSELSIGDKIINFNSKIESLELDVINNIYDTNSNGDRYHFIGQGVDFTCTENHRIYYQQKSKNSKSGWSDWKICTAKEIFEKFNKLALRTKYDYRFPCFKNSSIAEYNIIDDKIYLLGCLLAEGSLSSKYGNGNIVSLSQSYIVNEKTHTKIQNCINNLNLSANIYNKNNGVTEWKFSAESSKELLNWFDLPNVHICPKYVYNFSQKQARILFDALMDCDGCWGSMSYTSKRYLLATDFQSIAHLAGFRTSQISKNGDCNVVQVICKNKPYVYIQDIKLSKNNAENVWCINTNNGTIITRDNDCLFISGNCKAMWLMLQKDKPEEYVIGTGQTHTVKEFLVEAFSQIGVNDFSPYVEIDETLKRPAEVPYLCANAEKAYKDLGWKPEVDFKSLVKIMLEN